MRDDGWGRWWAAAAARGWTVDDPTGGRFHCACACACPHSKTLQCRQTQGRPCPVRAPASPLQRRGAPHRTAASPVQAPVDRRPQPPICYTPLSRRRCVPDPRVPGVYCRPVCGHGGRWTVCVVCVGRRVFVVAVCACVGMDVLAGPPVWLGEDRVVMHCSIGCVVGIAVIWGSGRGVVKASVSALGFCRSRWRICRGACGGRGPCRGFCRGGGGGPDPPGRLCAWAVCDGARRRRLCRGFCCGRLAAGSDGRHDQRP